MDVDGVPGPGRRIDGIHDSQVIHTGIHGAKCGSAVARRLEKHPVLIKGITRVSVSRRPEFRLPLDAVDTVKGGFKSPGVVDHTSVVRALT